MYIFHNILYNHFCNVLFKVFVLSIANFLIFNVKLFLQYIQIYIYIYIYNYISGTTNIIFMMWKTIGSNLETLR